MKYVIAHECRGRIRIRIDQKHMSLAQADLLEAWLQRLNGVQQAVVHERTCCAVIRYSGTRADLLQAISRFRYDAEDVETPVQRAQRPRHQPALSGKTGGSGML